MNTFISTNPVTGELVWQGTVSDSVAVNAAVTKASAALNAWRETSFEARQTITERYAALVVARKQDFAELIARETGKSLWDALTEAGATAGKVALCLQAYAERTGERRQETATGEVSYRHQAHGVMAVIGPFNFPAHLPNGHIVPAFLAGNTVVFKPSEQSPAVAALMAELWNEAGLPEGVLTLVQGDGNTGRFLVENPMIAGVLFTGGEKAGLAIHRSLAGRPEVMLALELGGNNPLVAWDVTDFASAASLIAFSGFVSAGQRCTCARRLIIPTGAEGDQLVEALVAQTAQLTVGNPLDEPAPFMGSLVSASVAEQFRQQRSALISLGAKTLYEAFDQESGAIVHPAIIEMTGLEVPDEELFGPLLQVYRVDSFDAAIALSNNTRFGLAAALVSNQSEHFEQFKHQVRAGIINFNKPTAGASGSAPFGGVGVSGNHRPSGYYAADYCAYPIATMSSELLPTALPGVPK